MKTKTRKYLVEGKEANWEKIFGFFFSIFCLFLVVWLSSLNIWGGLLSGIALLLLLVAAFVDNKPFFYTVEKEIELKEVVEK